MKRVAVFNKALIAIFCILSLLACYYKVLYGVSNDEEYLVAMGLRLNNGDRLFSDMWELHQTTALYLLPFMKLFTLVTGGYEGVFVFFKVVNLFLQFIISLSLYFVLRKKGKYDRFLASLCALLIFNFMPKWVADFEYAQIMYFFIIVSMSFLYRAKLWTELFLSGVFFALDVWAYPIMLAVFPGMVACIYLLTKKKSDPLWFSLGCVCTAIPFTVYVLRGISLKALIDVIPYIISDETHVNDHHKVIMLMHEVIKICGRGIPVLLVSVIICFLYEKISKKRSDPVVSIVSISVFVFFAIIVIANCVGRKSGPFGLNTRYIILYLLGFYLYFKNMDRENRELFLVFYII